MNTNRISPDGTFEGKAEVYGKDGPLTRAIERVASLFGDAFDGIKILVIDRESDATGEILSILKEKPKTKVIIVNLDRYAGRRTDDAFANILKYPNTRLITDISSFMEKFAKFAEELKDSSEIGIEDYKVDELQRKVSSNILGILQHDLKPYVIEEKGTRYREIIDKARSAFDIHPRTSDKSVEDFILNTPREVIRNFEGEISGVYCDIDDTIIGPDGEIIEKTLMILNRLEGEGHKIHIWTGGNLETAKEKLASTPFERYPLLSKHDHAGAHAEIVIDNVSPEKFALQTGITAKRFIRI